MPDRPHKPVSMAPWRLEASESEEDAIWRLHPERRLAIAHDTAQLLVRGIDGGNSSDTLERLNTFVDREGVDTLAELWAGADPVSLPGALWRLFRIREQVRVREDVIGEVVQRGLDALDTIDPVVVGAQEPVTAAGVGEIINQVLRGGFSGDLAPALERASALARVIAAGLLHWPAADDDQEHDVALRSLSWGVVATELADCAKREKNGQLR
jgi:hypothetical protein